MTDADLIREVETELAWQQADSGGIDASKAVAIVSERHKMDYEQLKDRYVRHLTGQGAG